MNTTNTPQRATTRASTAEQRNIREPQQQQTDRQQNKAPRHVVTVVLATVLAAILVFSGCSLVTGAGGEETTASTEQHQHDADSTVTPLNKSGWEHNISSSREGFYEVIVNREIGRATIERLEHIAETLDRIAVLLENHTENDRHQQPTSPTPNNRTGPHNNDNG